MRQAREKAVQPSACEIIGFSNSDAYRAGQGIQMSGQASLVRKPPSPLPSLSPCLTGRFWRVGKQMSISPTGRRTALVLVSRSPENLNQ